MSDGFEGTRSSLTLGDLLAGHGLGLRPIVFPPGAAERPISWVHATERLDPRPHVRAGELICTLGSALLADGSHPVFVDSVRESGAAGICLGLGEVHLEAPQELIDACERLGMPLLLLSHGVPFMKLNERVLMHRAQVLTTQVQQETGLIAELLELARSGQAIAMLLDRAATRYPGQFTVATSASGEHASTELFDAVSWQGYGEAPSAEFLAQLANVLELSAREHERSILEREQRLGQLMRLLLEGLAHPVALRPELEADGLGGALLRVSCWPVGSQGLLRGAISPCLVALTDREVLLVTEGESDIGALSVKLGLISGFSSEILLPDVGRAVSESRAALRVARRRGAATGPEYLTTFEALLEQQPAARLSPFIDRLIAPIEAAGPRVGPELVRTLSAFLVAGCSVQATSDALSVHPNTIRHRLARVTVLSGLDPLQFSDAVDLRVAVWAWERQRRNAARMVRPFD